MNQSELIVSVARVLVEREPMMVIMCLAYSAELLFASGGGVGAPPYSLTPPPRRRRHEMTAGTSARARSWRASGRSDDCDVMVTSTLLAVGRYGLV